MTKGEQVTLVAFGGKQIKRTVVQDLGDVILICKHEEFEASVVENREPISVGFKKDYLVNPR